jgi:hypothetical protein
MESQVYRYRFAESLDIAEVQATVTLALLATESLHGESRVRLEMRHGFDAEHRTCNVEAAGEVGRDFNRLLSGLVSKEFGRDSFQVERAAGVDRPQSTTAA